MGFSAPNVTTSRTYIFPAADGSSGTSLTTDGSGNLLTFDGSTLALTGAMTVSTNNTIAFRSSGLTIGSNVSMVI